MKAVKGPRTTRRLVGLAALLLVAACLPVLNAARSQALSTPAKVTVSPNPAFVVAVQYEQSPVSATVLDASNHAVANQAVTWTSSGGASFHLPTSVTNAQGVATTNVVSDGVRGRSTITAIAGTASGTATLYEYSQSANLSLKLQPSALPPDGSSTSLATLTVTDSNTPPDPVPEGVVTMATSGDVAIGPVTNRGDGTYVATITASRTADLETITATHTFRALPTLSTTALLSEYGPGTNVTVNLAPSSIAATGTSTSVATATVKDANGAAVPNDVVAFSSSGDAAVGPATNNGDGTYTATITSSKTPGSQTITATATHGGVTGTATLTQTFGALHVSGNQIQDVAGNRIILEGIHRDGLEVHTQAYDPSNRNNTNYVEPFPVTQGEMIHAHQWGANVIRLSLSEDFWNQSCPAERQTTNNTVWHYDPNYRNEVVQVVNTITSQGMLALLDLHTTTREQCEPIHNASWALPARGDGSTWGAPAFWKSVVPLFGANPLVAFELYNEPHVCQTTSGIPSSDLNTSCNGDIQARSTIWRDGGTLQDGNVLYTGAGMKELYDTVQGSLNTLPAGSPSHLVFVDGNGWAGSPAPFNAQGSYTMFTGTNLAYAEHVYTCSQPRRSQQKDSNGKYCQDYPVNSDCLTVKHIIDNFQVGDVPNHPLVADEFGWADTTQPAFNQAVVSHLHDLNLGFVGFAWAGWVPPPTSTDWFELRAAYSFGPNDATASGQPIKNALSGIYPPSPC